MQSSSWKQSTTTHIFVRVDMKSWPRFYLESKINLRCINALCDGTKFISHINACLSHKWEAWKIIMWTRTWTSSNSWIARTLFWTLIVVVTIHSNNLISDFSWRFFDTILESHENPYRFFMCSFWKGKWCSPLVESALNEAI